MVTNYGKVTFSLQCVQRWKGRVSLKAIAPLSYSKRNRMITTLQYHEVRFYKFPDVHQFLFPLLPSSHLYKFVLLAGH